MYSEQPLDRNLGLAFNYDTTLDVFLCPGLRGFLILWSEKTLLVSPNSGERAALSACRMRGPDREQSQVPSADPGGRHRFSLH